jgi:ABC-2 type transport system ATP-binding protein
VASATQLGVRLRVLIPESIDRPLERIRKALEGGNITAETKIDSASLEDVFVAVTLKNSSTEHAE